MISLAYARQLLPTEEQGVTDSELSALLGQLYAYADLVIDTFLGI